MPEHRFPACLDDCEDAARALLTDPAYRGHRFVVAGMSAGGYLAIQTSLQLAQSGLRCDAHVAIAPMVGPFAHFYSVPKNWWLSLFPPRSILWAWSHFLRGTEPHTWDWRVSALLATDEQLSKTSPGIVTFHKFDTLRDEAAACAHSTTASSGPALSFLLRPCSHTSPPRSRVSGRLCISSRYAKRLAAVGRLHAACELPFPHGSAVGMHTIMEAVAERLEARLASG